MAKPELTLSDLIAGQQRNELQLSSYMQKQLDAQLKTEKVLRDSKEVQNKTLTAIKGTSTEVKVDTKAKKESEQVAKSLTAKTGDGLNSNIVKMVQELKTVRKTFDVNFKGVLDKNRDQREFKSVGQRIGGIKDNVKDFFSVRGFLDKTGLVKRGSGGILSESLDAKEAAKLKAKGRIATGERARDPETGRIMGAKASEKQFLQDAKKEQALRRKQGDLERSIERKYKSQGFTEEQISTTPEAKQLKQVAKELVPLDPRGQQDNVELVSTEKKGSNVLSPAQEEYQIEQTTIQNNQLDLLTQIEENTRPDAVAEGGGSEGGEGKGGGLLKGIGAGLGALGSGLGKLGAGIGKGIKGILVGLAEGIVALGTAVATGVGAVGLAALAGIILTIAAALRIAAPAIKEFAPVLMKLAEQIGIVAGVIGDVLIEGIKMLPEIIGSIGDVIVNVVKGISDGIIGIIDGVTTSIERLAAIDGSNLLQVGAGLLAVAGGLAAFGAATALAGATNLVSNLLSIGQDSPVEQLEKIAKVGPNLNQAGTGVKNLAAGMKAFAGIDPKSIEALGKLPVDKIVAAAAGLRTTNAVAEASSNNKMKTLPSNQPASTNVVSAPTTITKQTKNVMVKQSIRNPEGSINSYIKSRYANAI